ncbi:uncharacterized protein BX663DRAFT_515028 [Cokeromyces recurvatus]|uniref:uncharacterized protein n=1 Tax=Cokeromyces recurvatus TaxID=90255 RepID=UPI00221E9210|nr:uncharacterized protein BX663DRAFT_515028 [Cokeromyces recurvatus]KAI7901126.1 hypothetical protein BX663DRAFT_515028 [Cokeromyces recurvatus]
MQTVGPPGFYNVPVTKFLMMLISSFSILVSILNIKQYFHLQITPHITEHHQIWRLMTSHMAFGNSSDVFFGLLLLYTLRVIERQYGCAKYIAFIFISALISTLLELSVLMIGARFGLKQIPGGPYAIIFSILYQYYRIIPVTYRFRVFGIIMTNKFFLYVLALQMALSQSFSTVIPAVCGIFSGALYRTDIVKIKRWRFPVLLQRLAERFIKPFLLSTPIARSVTAVPVQRPFVAGIASMESLVSNGLRNNRRATRNSIDSTNSETPSATAAEGAPSVREYLDTITGRDVTGSDLEPPSPEYTRILMTMFPDHPRETITRALSSAHNNLNRAVEIMLSTPAPNDIITGNSSSSSSSNSNNINHGRLS